MNPNLTRGLFIWVLAFVAVAEALLEAGEAVLDQRLDRLLLWGFGSIGLFFLAFGVEKYKSLTGE